MEFDFSSHFFFHAADNASPSYLGLTSSPCDVSAISFFIGFSSGDCEGVRSSGEHYRAVCRALSWHFPLDHYSAVNDKSTFKTNVCSLSGDFFSQNVIV